MNYGIAVRTALPFAAAAAQVRDSLREQGFGVLTEIDIQATLREKPVAEEAASRLRAALAALPAA